MDAPFPMDPAAVAEAIDIPLEHWPGNCHGVAEAVLGGLPVAGMRLVRGHFDGHVARDSVYRGGLQQHSWLELEDGRILDPTRWAMERPNAPFIYLGPNDHYDEGGLMMRARQRPAVAMSALLSGARMTGPQEMILKRLEALEPWQVEALFEAGGLPAPGGAPGARDADRLHARLFDPVEHFRAPEAFIGAVRQAGLAALVPIDTMTRVLEPEKVCVDRGANLLYEIPPAEPLTGPQKLFRVFCRFLSVESRDLRIEDELAEIGYTLEDLHDALNEMERWLKFDPEAAWLPGEVTSTLSVIAGDLLGKGFGEELAVERYAKSIGLDRDALHRELVAFGQRAGYDMAWLWGEEARRAEVAGPACVEEGQYGPEP